MEIEKKDILIRGVPGDVFAMLERRASRNFRSVTGEVIAILTAVCRSGETLPGLGVGEMLPDESGTVKRIERSPTVVMGYTKGDGE